MTVSTETFENGSGVRLSFFRTNNVGVLNKIISLALSHVRDVTTYLA
jgi:hypothetical protein